MIQAGYMQNVIEAGYMQNITECKTCAMWQTERRGGGRIIDEQTKCVARARENFSWNLFKLLPEILSLLAEIMCLVKLSFKRCIF